ncbi:hypothetical protein ASG43_00030 [Aureimonas sp. Leaf454]|uniref:hypothetical protein n=1 Tax=Aureimonas sp. Leaf454 TaxID=1736381 RepID=UPI0006FA301D|nr:hypothetical protein [Aureimonas sp. Leaf454]KQT54069.1 hypothetical protein ASG43_00030 [Aureimonas sp. Leaf454]
MQRDDFPSAIRALWTELKLGEPRMVDPEHVRLRIESIGIDLYDSGRGIVLIEAVAGLLSEDPARAARQVSQILRTNLGFLVDGDAGVFLRAAPSGAQSLVATSSYRLDASSTTRFVAKIEDTLRIAEFYAGELKGNDVRLVPARSPTGSIASTEPEAAVIFRP